jgi:hypothetical protein
MRNNVAERRELLLAAAGGSMAFCQRTDRNAVKDNKILQTRSEFFFISGIEFV